MRRSMGSAVLLCASLFLHGCATKPPSNVSQGGSWLLQTNLATAEDLKKMIEASKVAAHRGHTGAKVSDVVIGSGAAGSAVYAAQTGFWANPKYFKSNPLLAIAVLDALSGKGMKYHPLTYTYFFYADKRCDSRDCVNKAYTAFARKLNQDWLALRQARGESWADAQEAINPSGAFMNFFISEFKAVNPAGNQQNVHMFTIHDVDDFGELDDRTLWGNGEPKDFQDEVGMPYVTYDDATNLLLQATKANPSILIFRGIDRERANTACYGGAFLRQGTVTPIPELGCQVFAPPPAVPTPPSPTTSN